MIWSAFPYLFTSYFDSVTRERMSKDMGCIYFGCLPICIKIPVITCHIVQIIKSLSCLSCREIRRKASISANSYILSFADSIFKQPISSFYRTFKILLITTHSICNQESIKSRAQILYIRKARLAGQIVIRNLPMTVIMHP